MKYCLSSRQEDKYLQNADEIKFLFRDIKAIPDFIKKYPQATIIIDCNPAINNIEALAAELKEYEVLSKNKLLICVNSTNPEKDCSLVSSLGFKFYWNQDVNTFYQLNKIKMLNPAYIKIADKLFYSLPKVKKMNNIPIRINPTLNTSSFIPDCKDIYGTWIRPEDVSSYEEYVDTFEFGPINEAKDVSRERALYRIYHDEKTWSGALKLLFTDFNYASENRMIPEALPLRRINCGLVCQENGNCNICNKIIQLSDPKLIKSYKDSLIV